MSNNAKEMVYRCTVCWTVQEGFIEQVTPHEASEDIEGAEVGHCSWCGVEDALFKRVQRDAVNERNADKRDLKDDN